MTLKNFIAVLLFSLISLPARALIPGAEGNFNPALRVYFAGSSSVDIQIKELMMIICEPGTLDIFTDDQTKPEGNLFVVYYCVVSPADVPGLSTTHNLMVYKSSYDGSFTGLKALADGGQVHQLYIRPWISSDEGSCKFERADPASDRGIPVWIRKCDSLFYPYALSTEMQPVDVAINDFEPELWERRGYSFNRSNLETTIFNQGSVSNGNTFGVPVTLALRDALQTAQGLPSGSELAADQPSLSRSQIASILTGNITSWDQFTVDGFGLPAVAQKAPVNKRVQVCTGTPTSDLRAQADVFFNNYPCSTTSTSSSQDNTSFSSAWDGKTADDNLNPLPLFSAVTHSHQSAGGIADCLNVLQDANAWAIGVLPIEKSSTKFRFVAIDNVLPSLKNVANNTYGNWFSATNNWRNPNAPNPPTGDKRKVLELIHSRLVSPSILAQINAYFSQSWTTGPQQVGVLALPYKSLVTKVFSDRNPVATASREGKTGTGKPNSCKTPIIVNNAELGSQN